MSVNRWRQPSSAIPGGHNGVGMPGREHPTFLKPAWLGLPGSGVLLFDQVFRFKDERAGVVDVHPWAVDARGGLQDAGPVSYTHLTLPTKA